MGTQTYQKYADTLVFLHVLWTLFLLCGAVTMFIYPLYAIIQIIAMTGTLLLAIPFGNTCPLTLLEEKWRKKIDPAYHNDGSYIAAYFNKIFKKKVSVEHVNRTVAGLYVLAYAFAATILILHFNGFFAGFFAG